MDISTHSREIEAAAEDVRSDSDTDWCLFGYVGKTDTLKVVDTGEDGLEELVGELNPSSTQYAYVKVEDPNSKLPKFVLINWVPEGAPVNRKGQSARHAQDVHRFLHGAHVTINARNEEDIEEEQVLCWCKCLSLCSCQVVFAVSVYNIACVDVV